MYHDRVYFETVQTSNINYTYFKYRSKVKSEPKKIGDNIILRNERIRLNWRTALEN
jgi:hypothetical protein